MASSLADYASSETAQRRGPSPWVAALLSVLTPGLGHLYIGQAARGIFFFALIVVADTLLISAMMGVLARFWMFAVSIALLLGVWLYILIDATLRASRMTERPQRPYNKTWVYPAAFAAAWVITAVPLLYATQAKSSGHLRYFRAVAASMAPTLRAGEYFLADATYYQSHQPSRGEVAVYIHPKQSDMPVIKRIVAVEGDRVAIKGGRAIVNGMAMAEPYVDAGPAEGINANMPETRVPAGHVFVLGDNRAISVDSRDTVAHGPVPTDKLIGRVTDIAFSHSLTRMGRWIGTPSKF
jgi:signal peptidase I